MDSLRETEALEYHVMGVIPEIELYKNGIYNKEKAPDIADWR